MLTLEKKSLQYDNHINLLIFFFSFIKIKHKYINVQFHELHTTYKAFNKNMNY